MAKAGTVQIPIEVPQFTQEEFYNSVIDAAARQLLHYHTIGDGEAGDEGYTVPTELERRLRKHIEDVIRERAREISPVIAKEILDEGIQQYDTYGSERGKKKPLKQVIGEEVIKQLTTHTSTTSRGEGGVFVRIIREEVETQLRGELKAALIQAKSQALEAVRTETQNAIAQALERALPKVN